MFLSPSVGQPELNPYSGRKIHRFTLALCRLEFDLLCSFDGGFVEAVSQAADHAVHLDAAVREEHQIQNHVSFNSQTTPFRGVLGAGLVQNNNRSICGTTGCLLLGCIRRRRTGVSEVTRYHRAGLLTSCGRDGRSISETGAGYRALDAFLTAGAISVAFTTGQSWRTKPVHIRGVIRVALARHAIRVTKSTGLHLVDGGIDGSWCRASGIHVVHLDVVFRTLGTIVLGVDLGFLELRGHVRKLGFHLLDLGLHDLGRQVREDVRLLWVQLGRFDYRRLNFYLRSRLDFRGWGRRWRRRYRNFRDRLSDLHEAILHRGLHLFGIEERNQNKENQRRDLNNGAQADSVPARLGVWQHRQTSRHRPSADVLPPSFLVCTPAI